MAHIDFAWELGGHTGHVTTLMPIARALQARGHDVRFLLKDPQAGADLEGAASIPREGAPIWVGPVLHPNPLNFGEILINFGYGEPDALRELIDAWRERLSGTALVIASVAPAAHLAALTLGIPSLEVSQGFHVPPPAMPSPPLRDWVAAQRAQLEAADARVLAAINGVLAAHGVPPLATIGELFAGRALLLTYPELDIYPERGPADYYGVPQSGEGESVPDWPAGSGPRVFGYLYNYYDGLASLLDALEQLRAPTLMFCRDIDPALARAHQHGPVHLCVEPMAVSRILPSCDLVVCHGSHQMTAQALLAGKPVLMLPTQLEQFLIMRRVVRQGAGLGIAPEYPGADFQTALANLAGSPGYAEKAREFAHRYASHDRSGALATMVERCEAELGKQRPRAMTKARMDPSRMCFVIPCKGRLAHLRQSLPHAQAQAACIVVDYDCPEHSGDWVNTHYPEVAVVRIRNEPGFNLARARNLGAAQTKAEWIVFLDADAVPLPDFAEAVSTLLRGGLFLRPAPAGTDTWGTLVCLREEFLRAGGYDEVIAGWGGEDDDLYARMLRMGLKQVSYPATLLRSVSHDDESRVRYYETKDRDLSHRVNLVYMMLKRDLQAITGAEPVIELRRALHAEVKRVLGLSLPTGAEARIELNLPNHRVLHSWGARRTLTYAIPPPAARPPSAARAPRRDPEPPMVFIVGTGRCGSTLLRLMLDSHPELAIPEEALFLPQLITAAQQGTSLDELAQILATHRDWSKYGLDAHVLLEDARRSGDAPLAALLLSFYRAYAGRFGKRRYGDKTIAAAYYIPALREVFPDARFVHLIRDGRDVALSMRGLWWTFDSIAAAAAHWAVTILTVRADAPGPDQYLELRYEDLVCEPEAVLRRVCAFLDLPWHQGMLDYPERAAARLEEVPDGIAWDGGVIPSERVRLAHLMTLQAPTGSRIGAWRGKLDAKEVRSFELLAGSLLAELGYDSVR